RIAHLARRAEEPGVVSISPEAACAAERAIHRFGHADREATHTTLEVRRPVRFHKQVEVILLNAEVQDAEAIGIGAERVPCADEEAFVPEGGNAGSRAQRYVGRTVAIVRDARAMRHAFADRLRLAPCSTSSTAPRTDGKLKLLAV